MLKLLLSLLLALCLCLPASCEQPGGYLYMINVGKGDAIIVNVEGRAYLIDTGKAENGKGGGAYAAGTVTMNGNASIKNSESTTGGGLYANDDVNVSGNAAITANSATGNGGGVLLNGEAKLTMSSNMVSAAAAGTPFLAHPAISTMPFSSVFPLMKYCFSSSITCIFFLLIARRTRSERPNE